MKFKFWALLLVLLLSFTFLACSKEEPAGSNGGEKQVMYQIVNAANEDWVLMKSSYDSDEYRGETDAVHVDFKVGVGERMYSTRNSLDYEDAPDAVTEVTKDTYEYKVQLIAGGTIPTDPDEQFVHDPYVLVEDFIIKGTYNEMVTIEWNGTSFNQVD